MESWKWFILEGMSKILSFQLPVMGRDRGAEDESLALKLTKKNGLGSFFLPNPTDCIQTASGNGLWVVLTPLPAPGIVWESLDLHPCW